MNEYLILFTDGTEKKIKVSGIFYPTQNQGILTWQCGDTHLIASLVRAIIKLEPT